MTHGCCVGAGCGGFVVEFGDSLHALGNFRRSSASVLLNCPPMNEPESMSAASPAPANPERWVDEHGDCLYRYALLRVRKPDLAEDLVQDTLSRRCRGTCG